MKKLVLMAIASMFLFGCATHSAEEPAALIPVDLKKSDLIQELSDMAATEMLDVQYLLAEAEMNNRDMVEFREQLVLALGKELVNNSFIPQSEIKSLLSKAKAEVNGCYVEEGYEYFSPVLQDDVIFVVENMRVCSKDDGYVLLDTSLGRYQMDISYGDIVMTTTREASMFHNYVKSDDHSYTSRSLGHLTLNDDFLSFETSSGIVFEVDSKGIVTRSDTGLIGIIHQSNEDKWY